MTKTGWFWNGAGVAENLIDLINKQKFDDDGVLVTSGLKEYYFDSGALFKVSSTVPVNLSAGGQYQVEIQGDGDELRLFEVVTSTLSNKYRICIFEVDKRDLSEETDATQLDYIAPNRTNIKELPGTIYALSDTVVYPDVSVLENIYAKIYILQDGGGPQASDLGGSYKEDSMIRMNLTDHNYVFCITNEESTDTEDFYLSIVLCAPGLLGVD